MVIPHPKSSQGKFIGTMVESYYEQSEKNDRQLLNQLHKIVDNDNCNHRIKEKFMIIRKEEIIEFITELYINLDCNIHNDIVESVMNIIKQFRLLFELQLFGPLFQCLPNELLRDMRYLRSFSMKNTSVKEIPPDFFTENKFLYSFNLRNNSKLEKIPEGLFNEARELSSLSITENSQLSLPINLLDNQLYLSHLRLTLDGVNEVIVEHFESKIAQAKKEYEKTL